jgi:glycosyltransferase involved in cell wall biosynthesis
MSFLSTPSVSVVVPTYNRSRLVKRAVASVLRAVRDDDEVIVVDDGSTDDTEAVISSFGSRVRYVSVPNGGPGRARNHGIRAATRPLVAFLDSDDEWLPDKLELQRALMAVRPELVCCFSTFLVRDDDGGEVADGLRTHWLHDAPPWSEVLGLPLPYSSFAALPPGRPDFPVHIGDLYAPLLEQPYVAASTVMVRRALAGDALSFPEDLRICEDWTCFANVARRGAVAYLDCATAINHGHAGPRLTAEQGQYGLVTSRIRMTESIWGRDDAFLATHADRYREVLEQLHSARARWLISHGRSREALDDLRQAGRPSRTLKLLSRLPGPFALGLGEVRRAILRITALLATVGDYWG